MEKKNVGMKVAIVILCLLIVGLTGYIVYDKVFSKDNDKCVDNNISNRDENNISKNDEENIGFVKPEEHVELEDNIKSELIEIFNFVHDYNNSHYYGFYCVGDTDKSDVIDPPGGSVSWHKYNIASKEYSTFNEMIDYLKNYMTVNVIYSSQYMDDDNFIEKDGKLYCPYYETNKGDIGNLESVKIKYSKPYENVIYTTIERTLVYEEDNRWSELFDVTFSKRNNKWIISSYNQFVF